MHVCVSTPTVGEHGLYCKKDIKNVGVLYSKVNTPWICIWGHKAILTQARQTILYCRSHLSWGEGRNGRTDGWPLPQSSPPFVDVALTGSSSHCPPLSSSQCKWGLVCSLCLQHRLRPMRSKTNLCCWVNRCTGERMRQFSSCKRIKMAANPQQR